MNIMLLLSQTVSTDEPPADTAPPIAEVIGEVIDIKQAEDFFSGVWDAFVNKIPVIIFALVVLLIGFLATKSALALMKRGLKKTNADPAMRGFIVSVIKIILYVLLFTVVLSLLGVPTTSIITVIGTAGVAVGLALQNILSNVAGGFLIMFTKPFKKDDFVQISSYSGCVSKINIIYTELITVDNKVVYIPNGQIASNEIVNFSSLETRRVNFTVSFPKGADIAAEKKKILARANSHPLVIKEPEDLAPVCRITAKNHIAVTLAVRVWCLSEDYWTVYYDMMEFE